jgi:hypothetical protein
MAWRERRVVDSPNFPGYRALGPAEARPGRYDEAMTAAAVNLREAVLAGAPLACTGDHALAAERVAEAVRAAALPESQGQEPS